jgi:hypothetical protein
MRSVAGVSLACILLCAAALRADEGGSDADGTQSFYRYTNKHGRVVYTNIAEQVPPAERARSRVDLRHVSLNTEVGTEIDRRLEEQHAALMQTPYCRRMRAAAEVGFTTRLWEDFAPLIACGGLLLGFLFYTPSALRRFGAPAWAKVLMMAIPALAISGLVMFSMSYTNETIAKLKQQAKPCAAETFARLSGQQDAVMQHSQLVDKLQQEIAKIEQEAR